MPEKYARRPWTNKEIDILTREYLSGKDWKEISVNLKRGISAIKKKVSLLGIGNGPKKWTKEDIETVILMYKKGHSIDHMCKSLNRTKHGIRMRLSIEGVSNRLEYWVKEDIDILKDMYLRKCDTRDIAQALGREIQDVRSKACTLKITYARKYNLNDNYFNSIDTQKKAYWLGWLLSDGYVRREGHKVVLKLAVKDIEVLNDFKKDLEAENPILYEKPRVTTYKGVKINGTGAHILSFSSKQIRNDIAEYGIVPAKTYSCVFPEKLRPEYYPGFVSGIISGDGSISIYKKINTLSGNIVGSKELLESIKSILVKEAGYNPDKKICSRPDSDFLHCLYFSKKQVLLLSKWLANNDIQLMPRKQKIIDDYINNYPERCQGVA